MRKEEIEQFLENKGDFVRIDHLSRFLKDNLTMDIKKYVAIKLGELYDKKLMFSEAAKMYDIAAIFSIPFAEKIKYYTKEAELFIKTGAFDRADEAVRKAMVEAKEKERAEIYVSIKEFYKKQAQIFEKENRRSNSLKIYEKLLEMNLSGTERGEVKEKLLSLYEKTGKLKEYYELKRRK